MVNGTMIDIDVMFYDCVKLLERTRRAEDKEVFDQFDI